MNIDVFLGLTIPFLGTAGGAACIFFMRGQPRQDVQKALNGFASGVMTAASVWSLLIPAMDLAKSKGRFSFIPAVIGFWIGVGFLLLLDHLVPHMHLSENEAEGPKSDLKKSTMMMLAVTLHNIPEGMALGIVYAGYLAGSPGISLSGALALSLGIALQNFPEGAIISMPLHARGQNKSKAFINGVLSGVVEPIGSIITIIFANFVIFLIPYLLSFAAGAMIYVVVEEMMPEISQGEHSHAGVLTFSFGFSLMMALDVALG